MNSRIHPNDLLFPGAVFGIGMVILATMLMMLSGSPTNLNDWYPSDEFLQESLLGILLGAVGAMSAWAMTSQITAFIRLRNRLIAMMRFEALKLWHALAFGVMAGVPEEILFRGAVQPQLGLILTALVFGALHAISWIYFVYAAGAGLLLGLMVEWRGNLWAATTAHFAYDAGVFLLLTWYVAQQEKSRDEVAYS
jgi:hypothetical protein